MIQRGEASCRVGGAAPEVRVVGVGSAFGCDRCGWDVVEDLARRPWEDDRVRLCFVRADRPGMRLLEAVRGAALAIVIDALLTDAYPPGKPILLSEEILGCCRHPGSSHGLGVAEALALGRALGEALPPLMIIGLACPDPAAAPGIDFESVAGLVRREIEDYAGGL